MPGVSPSQVVVITVGAISKSCAVAVRNSASISCTLGLGSVGYSIKLLMSFIIAEVVSEREVVILASTWPGSVNGTTV